MKVVGIIPARFNSTRLPGKPLKMIGDKSLIMRVYHQCLKVAEFDEIVVATDDVRILKHVQDSGGKAVMTSPDHGSGTERCYEALGKIKGDFDFVLNVQGDEPFINPEHISSLINSLDENKEIATLCMAVESNEELLDPGNPKLVLNRHGYAQYFSRAVIPYDRDNNGLPDLNKHGYLRHIGIYAYRSDILATIISLAPSSLEKTEHLEQLRWLDNGFRIYAVEIPHKNSVSVDTESDLIKARNLVEN